MSSETFDAKIIRLIHEVMVKHQCVIWLFAAPSPLVLCPGDYCRIALGFKGPSTEICLAAGDAILRVCCTGLHTIIRRAPEAEMEIDFATDRKIFNGYVSFAVKDEPGEWDIERVIKRRSASLVGAGAASNAGLARAMKEDRYQAAARVLSDPLAPMWAVKAAYGIPASPAVVPAYVGNQSTFIMVDDPHAPEELDDKEKVAKWIRAAFERDFAKFIMAGDAALGFVPLPDPHPVPELNGPVHHKEPFPAQALKRWGAR